MNHPLRVNVPCNSYPRVLSITKGGLLKCTDDCTAHAGLGGLTPLASDQRDLPRIRSLGAKAAGLDALFHHRIHRLVRKDGTVSYLGERFEVPYELSGKTVRLVMDPHTERAVGVEDEAGNSLDLATALDAIANIRRVRRKPEPPAAPGLRTGRNLVEMAHAQHHGAKVDGAKQGD